MNLMLRPASRLPEIFSNWLRSDTIFDREFFDPQFVPVQLGVNVPSVNIKETAKEYMLEVAAPGLERKDFNLEVTDHTLKISAEKEEKKDETKENDGYSRKEYSYSSFSRSFTLPENVREGNIDAKYENGILTVHVPKAKETSAKPVQKIDVQ